jgi:hypothetical protein
MPVGTEVKRQRAVTAGHEPAALRPPNPLMRGGFYRENWVKTRFWDIRNLSRAGAQ